MSPLVTMVLSFFFLLVGVSFALWTALTLKSPAAQAPMKRSRPAATKPPKPKRHKARKKPQQKRDLQPAPVVAKQTLGTTEGTLSNDHVRGANAVPRLSIKKTVAESVLVTEMPGPLPLWSPRELEGGQTVPASAEDLPTAHADTQTLSSEQTVYEAATAEPDLSSPDVFKTEEQPPREPTDGETEEQTASESEADTDEIPTGEGPPDRKPGRDRDEDAFERFLRAGSGDFDF